MVAMSHQHPIYSCMTKATTAEVDGPRHSANWVTSRRAKLHVFADRLQCRNWTIPYREMTSATLFRTKALFVIPFYVLHVVHAGTTYQFGLNPNRFWAGPLPFETNRESVRMSYSPFSLAIRLLVVVALLYWLWTRRSAL